KNKDKPVNGRCKLHGGKSTGPKTEAGREAIRESNRRRAKERQASSGE
ncbi:HGGxSTG domain-containing protein, partial [Legionella feeleii]